MNKLVVAISSRALFQLDESHAIFESQGVAAYCSHQRENEHVVLEPGPAFNLVRKLLALNKGAAAAPMVEVVLLSRNSADTGLRIFNSIEHYQLDIKWRCASGPRALCSSRRRMVAKEVRACCIRST